MPTYLYKATDSSGKVVNGSLEAEGEKGVVTELHNMGFIPMRIALSKGGGKRLDVDISKQIGSFLKEFPVRISSPLPRIFLHC